MLLLKSKHATGLGNLQIDENPCEAYVYGKQSRLPFISTGKKAKNLLDIVHSDLCGPMSVDSIGGAKYFLIFVDDHSRKMFIFFIKHKNE